MPTNVVAVAAIHSGIAGIFFYPVTPSSAKKEEKYVTRMHKNSHAVFRIQKKFDFKS